MTPDSISKAAEIKILYKTKVKAADRPKLTGSYEAAQIFRPFFDDYMEYKEAFHVAYLTRENRVLAVIRVSEGGLSSTVVDARQVMQPAILLNAGCMILAHNHPSGNLKPSDADRNLTNKIREAAKLFDIELLDHIILTADSHYSFADDALI